MWIILVIIALMVVSVGVVLLAAYLAKQKRNLPADAEFVRKLLPGVDCGMCGEANCTEFARKVQQARREPDGCKLIEPQNAEKIREYFKPTYIQSSKLVAMVKCKGGCLAEDNFVYNGSRNCAVEERLHSGSKACKYACLGCGDCVHACRFGAIRINERKVAEVIRSKCTGCGLCVKSCPNNLITMNKLSTSVGVICNNQSDEKGIEKKCKVGCNHCFNCINVCPTHAITMVDGIPTIDPKRCVECYRCVAACPNHVISRL